jgi:hypothetical protein
LINDIHSYETFSTLIKAFSLKALELPPTFDKTNRSLYPSLPAWHFNNFCKYISVLIISINSCNVCVLHFGIYNNKLNLFKATCSIIGRQALNVATQSVYLKKGLYHWSLRKKNSQACVLVFLRGLKKAQGTSISSFLWLLLPQTFCSKQLLTTFFTIGLLHRHLI